MLSVFSNASLIGKLWLIYLALALPLLGLAFWLDLGRSPKVDGAGGWFIFGGMMLSFWGLVITLLLSAAIWIVQLLF